MAESPARRAALGGGATQGYLLLADISGYTAFVTGTELEHSHAIITELTRLVRARLVPPMRFVKLEGDAVFCVADADAFPSGEQLIELAESCYFDFCSRLLDMERSTTCRCDACRRISGLDLKFVTHFGEFIASEDDDGRTDVAGPAVILAHRLLKNTIIERGGPAAYAYFTDPALRNSPSLSVPRHTETHESFGEVSGVVQDLAAVEHQRRAAQRVRITPEQADIDVSYSIDAPPAVVWQYFVDPDKRGRAMADIESSVVWTRNESGRIATGASSHCAHGDMGDALREYLDWRPYEYFSCRLTPLPAELMILTPWIETCSFSDRPENRTEFRWTIRCTDRSAEGLAAFETIEALIRAAAAEPTFGDTMRAAIAADAHQYGLEPQPRSR